MAGQEILIVAELSHTASCATYRALMSQADALIDRLNNAKEALKPSPPRSKPISHRSVT